MASRKRGSVALLAVLPTLSFGLGSGKSAAADFPAHGEIWGLKQKVLCGGKVAAATFPHP